MDGRGGATMRIFLIVLVASLIASIGLWNFGLAQRIWPEHPLLATALIAGVGAAVLELVLRRDARREAAKSPQR
jgi:hypothetical protein